jgi:hypothetical protein
LQFFYFVFSFLKVKCGSTIHNRVAHAIDIVYCGFIIFVLENFSALSWYSSKQKETQKRYKSRLPKLDSHSPSETSHVSTNHHHHHHQNPQTLLNKSQSIRLHRILSLHHSIIHTSCFRSSHNSWRHLSSAWKPPIQCQLLLPNNPQCLL